MARNNALNFNLPSVDDLFPTEESRAEARLEKVVNLNPSEISDFPDHPFKVRMDAAMQEMAESVKQYGVLVPALVRPKQGGGYEMVAGHRRKMAAELAQLPEIPCIVRNLTDDEATIIMVDSNLQREQILPSEKAFAYKMKLDAMKRQGQRTDLTSATVLQKSTGKTSRQMLAEQVGESHEQIRKYIRLTHLISDILELVDNSVLREPEVLQIAMRPAVELSYLRKEEQADLFAIMEEMDCTPSHAQAIKMRQMSEAKTGDERLAKDALVAIMKEEKPNQKEQIKIPKERISKYFAPGTPAQKIEDNQKIVEIIKNLDAEHPDNPVEFIIKDLTLKVKNASGRDDYLWEIGSASNWLAYHIATILAFQQFFQTRGSVAVPNFVIFDQPSQVYFPQRSRNSTLSEDDVQIADEDKQAVQKIFIAMDKFLHDTQKDVQIIVTEHADEDIWGDVSSSHLVERWRGSNDKLIPAEWITQG